MRHITGIHMNTGEFLGVKAEEEDSPMGGIRFGSQIPKVYPNLPQIKTLLEQSRELRTKLYRINKILGVVEVQPRRHGRIATEEYQGWIDQLKRLYAERVDKASTITVPYEISITENVSPLPEKTPLSIQLRGKNS